MKDYYVTFGQKDTHSVDNKTFDKDSVAVITAISYPQARKKAFEAFGNKFAFMYKTKEEVGLEFYSRGLINLKM